MQKLATISLVLLFFKVAKLKWKIVNSFTVYVYNITEAQIDDDTVDAVGVGGRSFLCVWIEKWFLNHFTPECLFSDIGPIEQLKFGQFWLKDCYQLHIKPIYPCKACNINITIVSNQIISSLVQENIFGVLTSSKISLRSLGVKWLKTVKE